MAISRRQWQDAAIRLCELALVATAILSVATAFDDLHRYLELFSHFRFQYFLASLLLVLVFIALRWRNYALLGIGVLVLNAWLVAPWLVPAGLWPSSAAIDPANYGEPIVVLHANVNLNNKDPAPFTELVTNSQPDLIIIQEATPDWLALISPLEALYPYRLSEPRDDPFGIALYSKFPLDSSAIIESVPAGFPSIVARAIIGGERLTIISTHPMPPIGTSNYGARNLQLDAVASLASRTPQPLIVIGDLNTTMWANHYRRFEAKSGLRNARAGFGIEPTWPLFFPPALIPIDHCLVSSDIHVADFRTGSRIKSDHLPILVTIALMR